MERRLPFILIAAGIALFLASFLFFAAPKACAAEVANNSLDKIVTLYRDKASSWETALRNYALTLFFLLAAIEFGVSVIRLALRGSDASEWLAELVNQVLFLGFFLALLNNSSAWARAIVDSFRTAANQAAISSGGSSNLAPSDIFDTGLAIASKVADQTGLFSPASSLGLIVCALVILICVALIAAFLVVSLVESYVVISAGVLLTGFGGSRFTKDYAVRTMTYAVSVGAKLFVLQLLIALGQQIFQTLSQSFEAKTTDIFVVVGSAVVMLALVKIIPEMIQALINGAAAFPFSTTSAFFLDAVDMMADAGTKLVVAFGNSLTDGMGASLNGQDRWPDVLSRRLHDRFGSKVAVVNAGIAGNRILKPDHYSAERPDASGPAATQRLPRDVLSLSGVSAVIWLQGINDLGPHGQARLEELEQAFTSEVRILRSTAPAIRIIGATLTSARGSAEFGARDEDRKALNAFIRASGLFDAFDGATAHPRSGALKPEYAVPTNGVSAEDGLHPNRAGYLAMAGTIDLDALVTQIATEPSS